MMPRRNRTRTRRRTDTRDPLSTLLLGAVLVVALGVLAGIVLRSPDGLPGIQYRTVYAVVPDVGNLQLRSDVRIAGRRVGQIMAVDAIDGQIRLEVQVSPGEEPIPSDSTVTVRSLGLLGQRYLEIRPGRATDPAVDGAVLNATTRSITAGVPEALQTFDAETRGGLGKAVRGLGAGLLGRGPGLNDALAVGTGAGLDFQTMAGAVTADRPAARRLLPALDRAAAALDVAKRPAVDMLPAANAALAPFVDRRRGVRATLDRLPGTLRAARPGLGQGERLLAAAERVAVAANRTLPAAPGALNASAVLLRNAPSSLRRTEPLLESAGAAVAPTLRLVRALPPILPRLREPLDVLRGPLQTIGRHSCDIDNFAQVWRSFLGFGVPNGGKIGPLGEIRATALLRMPFGEAGDAVRLPDSLVKRDTYPEPCTWLGDTYSLVDPTS